MAVPLKCMYHGCLPKEYVYLLLDEWFPSIWYYRGLFYSRKMMKIIDLLHSKRISLHRIIYIYFDKQSSHLRIRYLSRRWREYSLFIFC